MKPPKELEEIHLFLAGCANAIIPKEEHDPVVIANFGTLNPAYLSLVGLFNTNEEKALTARALVETCAAFKPENAIFICEAVLGEVDEGESGQGASECRVHFDVVQIQIEVPGAVHLWYHRLRGEFPNRTMEPIAKYHRHGPRDWGRFVLLPENQEAQGASPTN